MIDVFISYSRENKDVAQRLAEGVAREGYSVWWDEEIPPHLSYGELITEKIGNAKAAIVIWSRSASGSEWVRAEADMARSAKKLIQTSVDGTTPPLPFNLIQFAPLGDWNGEDDHPGWKRVKTSLVALCGPPAPPEAVVPPSPPPAPVPPPPAPAPSPPPPAPAPQPFVAASPQTTVPPTGSSNSSRLAFGLIGAAGAAALALGGYVWWRGDPPAPVDDLDGNAVAVVQVPKQVQPANPVPVATPPPSAPAPSMRTFTQQAMIDDADGFTNVRSGPSEAFGIVGRVNRDELFSTYPQTGPWWQVRLANGRVGYMSAARIRPYDPNQPPPSMDGRWAVSWRAGGTNYNASFDVQHSSGAMIVDFTGVRVRQTCSVQQNQANVQIRCRNPQFLLGKGDYSPDSFTLTLRDAPVIQGRIRDTQNVSATATFRRR